MKIVVPSFKIFVSLLCLFLTETGLAQNVGISSSTGFTPDNSAALDISFTNKGLLVPRVALTATNAAGPITSPATSLLVYNTATAGTAPTNVIPGYYYWNGVAWNMLSTSAQTAISGWSTTGNAGTTAGTNFIGTTDAVDFVLKANSVERLRIVNGTSSTTGTTGDITVGDANSGTLRATKEMVLRQDGDTFGSSTLRLRNRNGQNGALFETTGGTANLVDFIFNTGPIGSTISSNIRFETRSTNMKVGGNTTEWQFGQPDVNRGGPTLIVGASGDGSNSALRTGNFGVGATTFNSTNPEKLLVDAGTTSSFNVISGRGNLNNYLQLNIQNSNGGTNASSDVVATANDGTENTYYIDMGVNSSGNTANIFGNAHDAYLYNVAGTGTGGNFYIGTSSANSSLAFLTGGSTVGTSTNTNNERMRILNTGQIGIGTTTPNSTLSLGGSLTVPLTNVSGAYSILATDHVIINTGSSTGTWTLPAASTCSGRVYKLVNQSSGTIGLSPAVYTANATTSTSLSNVAGLNTMEVISDGTNWRVIGN